VGVVYNADALSLDDMLHFAFSGAGGCGGYLDGGGWRDAVVPLTAMAGTVKTVRVGTAIAQMARPPVLTALSALSLAEYTGGRFVLGVGTAPSRMEQRLAWIRRSTPRSTYPRIYRVHTRGVHCNESTHPANYTGDHYQLRDYIRFLELPITQVPIYLAGVNPFMIQLAGSHSDGLILGPLNGPKYLSENVHPNLAKGLARANRKKGIR
jgi:alkanesulfonate monooxygenase SsuD/methylene tetrahydromethanopterin reductase-like flavin-dependent oxidoreductase (luciferase family)